MKRYLFLLMEVIGMVSVWSLYTCPVTGSHTAYMYQVRDVGAVGGDGMVDIVSTVSAYLFRILS